MNTLSGFARSGIACLIALSAVAPTATYSQTKTPNASERVRVSTSIRAVDEFGDLRFATVSSAIRLTSGMIVISDARSNTVSFFRENGKLVTTIGRRGDGPAEFRANIWVGECGRDSAFVFDRAHRRISVFTSAGKLARQFTLAFQPVSLSCSRNGEFAAPLTPDMQGAPLGRGATITYSGRIMVFGARGDSIGQVSGVSIGEPRALGKLTRIAILERQVAVATGDSDMVEIWSFDGKRSRTFKAGVANRKIAPLVRDRAMDALVSDFSDAKYRVNMKRLLLQQPAPEFLPPYSNVLSDSNGLLWVVETFIGQATTFARAYNATGTAQMSISLPAGTQIMQMSDNSIVTVQEDADGDQVVVVYERLKNR